MLELSSSLTILFVACIAVVCAFEFINGFHDTANAVATVIYTRTLKPQYAVVWSGLCNLVGVLVGGIAVAMGIVNLLPVDILIEQGIYQNIAMVLAVLFAAIMWNLGTWYFGIPCSSSHTLIGSLLGVGIVFSMLPENTTGVGVNWAKAKDIATSLLVSPLFGFSMAVSLMFILKSFIKNKDIFKEPPAEGQPPLWIRVILFLTCTSVSFSHGSNDGQKGVGLMMIILITFLPAQFALSPDFSVAEASKSIVTIEDVLARTAKDNIAQNELNKTAEAINLLKKDMEEYEHNNSQVRLHLRKRIQLLDKKMKVFLDEPGIINDDNDRKMIKSSIGALKKYSEYTPFWTIILISLSLGLGTMVGWKRIVVTIGEKIGKRHMTYAEGATAEIIAASTIGVSTWLGLPVSTTHVLSSGVAGSMVASKGTKNLQSGTVKNIVLAWVFTLPVTIVLSGGLFLLFRAMIKAFGY